MVLLSVMCVFPGELAMWEYVDGVVSPQTGSDKPIGDDDCNSGTGGPVSCVSTSWTRSTEGDAYELAVFLLLITVGCVFPNRVNRMWGHV